MTEAQAKRARLKVWKDVLLVQGGVPLRTDSLRTTIRRLALVLGATPAFNDTILRLLKKALVAAGGTAGFNDGIYQTERKLAIALGSSIACCNLPPLQGMFDSTAGWAFGDPEANWMFGDGSFVFGSPT